jgi:hypothetical protein
MACNFKHVLKGNNECKENPAGLSNYCMVVPLDADHISSIVVSDTKNEYEIVPAGSGATALKGYRIDFKSQTGQVTSEDNGAGKGWTHTCTGRVEINEDDMAVLGRTLSNMDGEFLVFFPTGNTTDAGKEWKVVGNPEGDANWSTAADSGAARGDDHGTTFTVSCEYQLYEVVKWFGTIDQES